MDDFEFEPLDYDFNTICRFKLHERVKKYYVECNKNGGIKIGVDLLKHGYDLNEYYGNVYPDFNLDCMKAAIRELLKENR